MKEKRKVVFLCDSLSQPRCIKRILSFVDSGYDCEVYGYDRGKYNCNALPPSVKVTVLGQMKDGKEYLSKLSELKKQVKAIVREHSLENVLYYSFGFVSTFFFHLQKVNYVYEISDVLYGYPRFSKILWLLKGIDRRVIKDSVATVMTSDGFKGFFGIEDDKIIVQPNKVNAALIGVQRRPMTLSQGDKLVFAYVGAIRYDTILRFSETIGKYFPQHEYHFYGQASGTTLAVIQDQMAKYSNVKYFGAFKNPEGLEEVYSQINVVTACYTVSSLNERIAEPNKLYESLFFCKPIIVSDGIFLSKQVQKYSCGFCLDASTEAAIRDFVQNIDYDEINAISVRDSQYDASTLVDDATEILQKVNGYFERTY